MFFDDFGLEQKIDIDPVVIDYDEMIAFSKRYDPLPVHYDEEYAKTTRFGRVIAPGVMTFMTIWAKFVENDIFGDELIAGKSTKIEWFKPVFANDTLKGVMTVSGLTRRNAYNGIVETTIDVFNRDGEKVLSNVTETVVKCRDTE